MKARGLLWAAVAVVLAWLVIGGVSGPFAGRLSEVAVNDNAAFLPSDAEATRAQDLAAGFTDRETTPAIVVYERPSGITDGDREAASADLAGFARIPGVVTPLPPPIPSEDGQALEVIVPIDGSDGGASRRRRRRHARGRGRPAERALRARRRAGRTARRPDRGVLLDRRSRCCSSRSPSSW